MPCGREVVVWATCDRCGYHIDNSACGDRSRPEAFARYNGWRVSRNGYVLCDDCLKKEKRENDHRTRPQDGL